MVVEILIVILAVCGALMLLWCITGLMLRPLGGRALRMVYPACGEAEELEQAVRGAAWLREVGLTAGDMFIADCGMTGPARLRAGRLCERLEFVHLIPEAELPEILRSER